MFMSFTQKLLKVLQKLFSSKVVLVTGFGAETAKEFAKQGANVVITGRNKENLDKVAKSCEEGSPEKLKPLAVVGDVCKESDIENLIKLTIETFSKLDVLVNNAGVLESGTIETTTLAQYDRVMNTNIRSVYYLTMLATPHLIKTKGNIVNVSSVVGIRSFPNVLAYCTSKAALDQFTRFVALEWALKGVRVNAVNPGVIVTGIHMRDSMSEADYKIFLEKCKETHSIGKPGYPEEVSAVITLLAGSAASNSTGVTIPVDGGRHAMCPR